MSMKRKDSITSAVVVEGNGGDMGWLQDLQNSASLELDMIHQMSDDDMYNKRTNQTHRPALLHRLTY